MYIHSRRRIQAMDLKTFQRALTKFRSFHIVEAEKKFPKFIEQLARFSEGYPTAHAVAKELNALLDDLSNKSRGNAELRREIEILST